MEQFAIEVENLNYAYAGGGFVLKDISFKVREGEKVAIIGPNGAGKTTLLLLLAGILKGEGKIRIYGLEWNSKNNIALRKKIGFVPQDPNDQLFFPTLLDDVAFGPLNLGLPKEEVERRVKEALEIVGLSGYEGRAPYHLSFGEKKRASLATVLSMHPQILFLDEPTSNLDPRSRRNLIKLFSELKATLIIATHDLDMVDRLCSRALILNEGRIVREGEVKDILSDERLLEENGLL